MKNKSLFLNLIFILIFTTDVLAEVQGGRQHVLLDYNWKFILLNTINSENPNFDDTKWRTLNASSMALQNLLGLVCDPVIPLDKVIDAMRSVVESMPGSLCCSGLGGLSITPTSIRILEELKKNRQPNQ